MTPPIEVQFASKEFAEVAVLMAKAPQADAPVQVRADWLWSLSRVLDEMGDMGDQAEAARDAAVQLITRLIDIVAGDAR